MKTIKTTRKTAQQGKTKNTNKPTKQQGTMNLKFYFERENLAKKNKNQNQNQKFLLIQPTNQLNEILF